MCDTQQQPAPWVRYEVILPCFYNDRTEILPSLFKQTFDEVLEQFGAITLGGASFRGRWKDELGKVFEDENCRFFVDCKDTEDALAWFCASKLVWKNRFQQHSIWITIHPLRLI